MFEGIARDGASGALAADRKPVNPITSVASRFELKTTRISSSAFIAALVLSFVAISAHPAVAQSLANLPGQTELQIRTGTAITTVCVALIGLGTDRTGPSDTEDLFARCGDMVQTANDILGAGATTFSLGLTAAQTNEALVEIAHDEAAAFGTNSTEIRNSQVKAVAGRLSAIRRGATGFSLAGLQFDVPGEARRRVSLADMVGSLDSTGEAAGGSGESWFAGRLGAFLSGSIGTGDAEGSSEEAGYDVTLFSINAGLDYRITDSFVAGAAIGYGHSDSSFNGGGGSMDIDAFNITLYGTYGITDALYVEGAFGYTRSAFDLSRRIVYGAAIRPVNRTARGDPSGDQFLISFGAGYDIAAGGWTITPRARIDYLNSSVDGFTESGARGLNLRYRGQDYESLASDVGADIGYAISTDFGVVVPQASFAWIHEYMDDSQSLTVQYAADPNNFTFSVLTDNPDRDYFGLGLSLLAVFPGGINGFVNYSTIVGHRSASIHVGTIGLRFEF